MSCSWVITPFTASDVVKEGSLRLAHFVISPDRDPEPDSERSTIPAPVRRVPTYSSREPDLPLTAVHCGRHPNVESPSSNLSTSSALMYGAIPTRSAGSPSFKAAKTS